MNWFKSKPYWLRGGIIGLIIIFIPYIFLVIGAKWFSSNCGPWCLEVYGSEFWGIIILLPIFFPFFYLIIIMIPVLGALIGYIYEKIKSKKQNQ